ncbi:phosphatase PAP2 family protein [Occallatibacter savannae]|uniref:phosphatase PAP2 family protein n=1 Tax=Occallatibacter savannae TaxID=1002691 RepID=UPI0013A54A9F|nr:phosphatase PAP2 family protein [Occallatibacter savannae]
MNLRISKSSRLRSAVLFVSTALLSLACYAQTWPPAPIPPTPNAPEPQNTVTVREIPMNLLKDQGAIWSSPARIGEHDLNYLVPLGLATALAMTTDHQVMSEKVSRDKSLNDKATQASNALVSPFIAAPVVMYGIGHLAHSEHARETGILSGEALVDSLVVEQAMKLAFMRERPTVDGARGKFFQTSVGVDGSFPSNHSMLAWSSAAVLADEYPSTLHTLAFYGVATGVSITRVLGQQHFPSDVLVGSAFGWMIGHYVYKKHHHWEPENYR